MHWDEKVLLKVYFRVEPKHNDIVNESFIYHLDSKENIGWK